MFEYSKENRVRKSREWKAIYSNSSKWISSSFVVLGKMVDNPTPKLGVVVSKKIGNSVTRNRLKRLCRETFRNNKASYSNLNVVLIARQGLGEVLNKDVISDVRIGLSKIYKKLLTCASSGGRGVR